jgi:hypothetical protein
VPDNTAQMKLSCPILGIFCLMMASPAIPSSTRFHPNMRPTCRSFSDKQPDVFLVQIMTRIRLRGGRPDEKDAPEPPRTLISEIGGIRMEMDANGVRTVSFDKDVADISGYSGTSETSTDEEDEENNDEQDEECQVETWTMRVLTKICICRVFPSKIWNHHARHWKNYCLHCTREKKHMCMCLCGSVLCLCSCESANLACVLTIWLLWACLRVCIQILCVTIVFTDVHTCAYTPKPTIYTYFYEQISHVDECIQRHACMHIDTYHIRTIGQSHKSTCMRACM